MKNACHTRAPVSTLARLRAAGVSKLDLLSSGGVRDLLRAEIARRMAHTGPARGEDIDALAQKSLREFTSLLEEHLTGTRGGSGVLPWILRSPQGGERTHEFFVLQPGRAAAACAAPGS